MEIVKRVLLADTGENRAAFCRISFSVFFICTPSSSHMAICIIDYPPHILKSFLHGTARLYPPGSGFRRILP